MSSACAGWTGRALFLAAVAAAMGQGCPPPASDMTGTPDPQDPAPPEDPTPPEEPVLGLELGVTESGVYHALTEGEPLPVYRGSQGGIHVFVTLRLTGFPPGGSYQVTSHAVMQDTGDDAAPLLTLPASFQAIAEGLNERVDYRVVLIGSQNTVRDREAILTFTVADPDDETVTASASAVVTFVDAP